ncbi:MAG: hypothetical protein C0599_12695 [Salinivirgaceae bacterium]|nr:MAG: hypothetical protein C0599_12695 [Salinivirgaceae bacterium]
MKYQAYILLRDSLISTHRIKILNNLLEPLLIIVVGLIVGFILVAMYLPLFQLGGGVI